MIPEAVKEFERNTKGDNNLEKSYFRLIRDWLQSDSYPPKSICKKIKGVREELYELKKSGTQARLLGYYTASDFFILKCIQKKDNKLKPEDIKTLQNRKQSFKKKTLNGGRYNEQSF